MAFSFTLPELRAELRALGHDGLPDHVILSFLSQLSLPLPSPSVPSRSSSTSLDSSGYDSEDSFCSTHSLSCGYGSPSTCSGDVAPLSFVELVNEQPHNRSSCQESTCVLKSKAKLHPQELHDGFSVNRDPDTVMVVEAPPSNKNGQHAIRFCRKGKPVRSLESAITEKGHTSPQTVGHHKPDAGCKARGIHHSTVRQELCKEASPDKIIEHYWISVGEEYMRSMHSKSVQEKQPKSPPALDLQTGTSASGLREGKVAYKSLIEKVEQCEDELQRLTLRLQAQQCKKPWFLEVARKPRVYQREKRDVGGSNDLQATGSSYSLEQVCTHVKESIDTSELSVTAVSSMHTSTENIGQESKSSSLDFVQECQETPYKNLTVSEDGSELLLDKEIYEADTSETQPAPAPAFSILEQNGLQMPSHLQDQRDKLLCGLGSAQRVEPDPSVCSKSSSASCQHSRSSGDSRSNASQKVSACSSKRRPCSTLQQQKRRGGKIDRVARFAEMQQLWKKDAFLVANQAGGKRKGVQSFHHHFSTLHSTSSC